MEPHIIEMNEENLQTGATYVRTNWTLESVRKYLRDNANVWMGAVCVGKPAYRYPARFVRALTFGDDEWFPGVEMSCNGYEYNLSKSKILDQCIMNTTAYGLPGIDHASEMYVVLGTQISGEDPSRVRTIVARVPQ
jgi:hypothetical protein